MTTTSTDPAAGISNRDTLFGDLPLSFWAGVQANGIPWSLFKTALQQIDIGEENQAADTLRAIIATTGLESRQYLQAYHFLQALGSMPAGPLRLFGVIVEVSLEQGHDFLAVYADHSARYYNYSGSAIIWDTQDETISAKIDAILAQGMDIVGKIGPWEGQRPAPPKPGHARINFLTSHGLHFGEASQSALFSDPMAKGIMLAMLDMMQTLMEKAGQPAA